MTDIYQMLKDVGIAHGPIPQNMFRQGSPCPTGPAAFVMAVLFNRMARRDGTQSYKGQWIELKAGQVCCSIRDLVEITEYTKKKVETAISRLKKMGILGTIEGTATRHNLRIYSINLDVFVYGETTKRDSKRDNKGTIRGQLGDNKGTQIDTANTANTAVTADPSPKGGEPSASPERGKDMDGRLFEEGRRILGPKAGGMIAKLKKSIGPGKTFELLMAAEKKSDPTAYVAAAMRDAPTRPEDVPIGKVIRNGRSDGRGSSARAVVVKDETEEEKKARLEAKQREIDEFYEGDSGYQPIRVAQ